MKINKLGEGLFHIVIPTRKELALCMERIQEYYESPFPEIRGKIFTLGQVRQFGSRETKGANTYTGGNHFEADWSGYNWPGYCLDPFSKGLFDPLTSYEEDLVKLFKYRTERFYVIGTYGEDDPSDTLEHEIRHAMYYLSEDYKKEVDKVLSKVDLEPVKNWLRGIGYAEEVILDECQAYLGPDHDWIFEKRKNYVEKYKMKQMPKISSELNKVASKYKNLLGISGK